LIDIYIIFFKTAEDALNARLKTITNTFTTVAHFIPAAADKNNQQNNEDNSSNNTANNDDHNFEFLIQIFLAFI